MDLPIVDEAQWDGPGSIELGAFSASIAVTDLDRSRHFYEALGFAVVGGTADENYLMLKSDETTIGLFTGEFEGIMLTFNPGLTSRMERLTRFTDVRQIQADLIDSGVEIAEPISAEAGQSGPGHLIVVDPDGNKILIDQFFASEPKS